MKVVIIEGNITELIADEAKMLTNGEIYCHDIRLAHAEDKDKWWNIDEGDVPQPEPDNEESHD